MIDKFTGFLIVWLIIYVFFPFRPDPLAQVAFSQAGIQQALFIAWSKIPIALTFGLILSIAKPKIKQIDLNWVKWIALIILPAVFIIDWLAGERAVTWGTMSTGGLMLAIGLIVANRFKHLGVTQGLMIAGLWYFGFIYGWEVMYQFVLWFKSGCSNIEGWVSTIINAIIIALPVIMIGILYRIKVNKRVWWIAGGFIITLGLWWVTGLNTLIYYENGEWIAEAMDYKSYIFTRLSKITLGLLPLGIVITGIRNTKSALHISSKT